MSDDLTLWDPALRIRAAALLAEPLRARSDEADTIARSLAPDGPGPGVRYHAYEGSLGSPRRYEPYQARFESIGMLLALLETGDPGAIELACEILGRLDPEAVLPAATLLLAPAADEPSRPVWTHLGAALGHALGRASSEESFRLLVDHPDVPHLRDGLATHGFSGGVAEAWSIVEAADVAREELDPRVRVQALPLVSYLLRHDAERAYPFVVRLLDASHEVVVFAAHSLAAIAPAGRDVLVARLAAAPAGSPLDFAQRCAVRLLLEDDALAVIDRLGGLEHLASAEGRPRLDALMDWLAHDTWRRKTEGGPRGWLAADPRFAKLLVGLSKDAAQRERAAMARDLLRTLPPELRATTSAGSKKTKAGASRAARATPEQPAPSAALVREMENTRDRLTRLVAHLSRTKYRFADRKRALVAPRAKDLASLARLERMVVVPASLACFWRVVGSVDLRGTAPAWPVTAYLGFEGAREPVWQSDPLVVAPAADVVSATLEEHAEPPFALHLAPDALGKAGYSAGLTTIWLPQETTDDARIEGGEETFLAHVRRALAWAGFPGLGDERALAGRAAPEAWLEEAREASR